MALQQHYDGYVCTPGNKESTPNANGKESATHSALFNRFWHKMPLLIESSQAIVFHLLTDISFTNIHNFIQCAMVISISKNYTNGQKKGYTVYMSNYSIVNLKH